VQIAITQPIRIEDAVIVENEWGWVEDIASTYVVIRPWDWRRMVVPLAYFIERPFQLTGRFENWGLTKEPFSQKNARVDLMRRRELFAPNRTRR
jgi:hypothetical protein